MMFDDEFAGGDDARPVGKLSAGNRRFLGGVIDDLAGMEPHDRVLTLARLGPQLEVRGLPADLHQQDLSDSGLFKLAAAARAAPRSRGAAPHSPPPMSDRLLAGLAETDRELGLPPGLSRKMFETEGGGPGINSRKGAMGRAQVMPGTLKVLNERFRKRGLGRDLDPYDDDDSVLIHRELMRENVAHFGDVGAAVAAYNGGWRRDNWDNPETRGYYQKNMGKPMPTDLGIRK